MFRPLILSAALLLASGATAWSQIGIEMPATGGGLPLTSNTDVNLGIPSVNTPNVPGTTLPTIAPGANLNAPVGNPPASSLPSVSTVTPAPANAQRIQAPNLAQPNAANATLRSNVVVDANLNGRRDGIDRRAERRSGAIGDNNPQIGADVRAVSQQNNDQWRYKYHNNHWWYFQPDNSWVIYHSNNWVPYNTATYSNYYPSTTTYSGGYSAGYAPSNQAGYYQGAPQRYNSYYRGNTGYGYNNGYNGYNNGYNGYNNGYGYGNRDLRYSDGSPGGNIGATIGGSIGRDAGGRQGGNIGAAIGGALGSGR
jgi:hypothetical protein